MNATVAALVVGSVLGVANSIAVASPRPVDSEAKKCAPEGGACKKTIDCCGRLFCKNDVCKV